MAVGGVPVANQTHAVDCVLAALEIEQLVSALREKEMRRSRPCWQIRIGIHSGDLVAGVVGREKFSYDVWGDTRQHHKSTRIFRRSWPHQYLRSNPRTPVPKIYQCSCSFVGNVYHT